MMHTEEFDFDPFTLDSPAVDYAEAAEVYTLMDSAALVNELGAVSFLTKLVPIVDNPAEQHALFQLLRVAEQADNALYRMDKLEIK
jgi:hypothetical protein